MGRKRSGTRVLGPYWDATRGQWKFIVVHADGSREHHRLRPGLSEESARTAVEDFRAELVGPGGETTVAAAVELYAAHLEAKGLDAASVTFARAAAAPLVERHGRVEVDQLTHRHLEAYLGALAEPRVRQGAKGKGPAKPLSMATQRSYWLALARMTAWWQRKRLTPNNLAVVVVDRRANRDEPLPWTTQAGRRAVGRGKAQLRNLGEARAYRAAALALEDAERRAAALLPLLTGLSSGELRHLRACDVDLEEGAIWVRGDADGERAGDWDVKTASRRRKLELPADCAGDLRELVDGLQATAYVFRQAGAQTPRSATWLLELVGATCEAASVRRVAPHGLRDTHASLRREVAGQLDAQIGEALGHNDGGKTAARNYIGAARQAPALKVT